MNISSCKLAFLASLLPVVFASPQAIAQKSGQSIQIQYGVVVSAQYLQERSDAGKAALVGGTVGYYANRNKSRKTKALSTAVGAGLAGAAKAGSEGSREARLYEVRTSTGVVKIISDQTEIHVDDCVVVENAGSNNANIRRVTPTYCDPASAEAVAETRDATLEEAEECVAAKRELAAADTDAAVDRALRKVSILCDS